jgi:hypothetical protein
MAAAASTEGSALCLACGLCCEGVLHTHALATPPDTRRLRKLRLAVEPFGNHAGFRLPCPLYLDHRCSVYPPRLHACQSYRCDVLSELLAGHLTLAAGLALVAGARELLADPALLAEQPFEAARLAEAQAAPTARQLAVDRLEHYLQRHFGK